MTHDAFEWEKRVQLHLAAQEGDLARVQALLESGADVNAYDDIGETPLHYAVENENFEMVCLLLDKGANVNAHHEPTIGNTPLAAVAGRCSLRMAEVLVAAGADPSIRGWMQLNALDRSKDRKRSEGRRVHELLLRASR